MSSPVPASGRSHDHAQFAEVADEGTGFCVYCAWLSACEANRELLTIMRDALPSLGANRRSYAQRALEEACALLDENPDTWRGGGELALEQEWRAENERLREALTRISKLRLDEELLIDTAESKARREMRHIATTALIANRSERSGIEGGNS